jgi:methylmalonyl-CoA/ethylmalonyl-CoA epimerase
MAKVKRIDHLAIAVKDVDAATEEYERMFKAKHIRTFVMQEKAGPVKVSYLQFGENILTLVQSLEEDGFIDRYIAKHGEGMHHLGLEVDDLDSFIREIEEQGFTIPLRDEFTNRKEVVLRPKDTRGVVMQVVEWNQKKDVTVEDRIQRILDLDNLPGESS